MESDKLKHLSLNLTLALLIFLPLSPFLVTVTNLRSLSLVRELLIIALLIVGYLYRHRLKISLVKDDLEQLIAWLVVLSLLSFIFITHDFGAWLWSARYSLEPLAAFWALHSFEWKGDVSTGQYLKWWLWLGLALTLIGILMVTVVPKDTLVKIGYSAEVAVGNGQWAAAAKLPAYQTVAGRIPRLQSTLTGPIQFAGFALLLFFLIPLLKEKLPRGWYVVAGLIGLVGILGSFSRAAWIALLIISLVKGYRYLRRKLWTKMEIAGLIIVLGVFLLGVLGHYIFKDNAERSRELVAQIFTRDTSDREHVNSVTSTLKDTNQIGFFGLGFGRSGAASIQNQNINQKSPEPRFVDNSYLRWYEELGVLGVIAFTTFIITLILELGRQPDPTARLLALAGTAIAITALFTDMWLEAVPVISFMLLAGIYYQSPVWSIAAKETKVLGLPISTLGLSATSKQIVNWSTKVGTHHLITVNPEMIYATTNTPLTKEVLRKADLLTCDGIGLRAAAAFQNMNWPRWRWLYYLLTPFVWVYLAWLTIFMPRRLRPIPERVTGSELAGEILKLADEKKQRLALLGSTKDILKKAKDNLADQFKNVRLVLAESEVEIQEDGTLSHDQASHLISKINHAEPDYLLVAFGVPKQELFLSHYKNQLRVPVVIGISGAFDSVLAKTVRRAPSFWQQLNIEWLWRLLTQPKRWNRIITAVWRFPWLVTKTTAAHLDK